MHMLKPEVADKLAELITPMRGTRILETGTGWAESATFFAKLKPDWTVYTVDSYGIFGDGRIYQAWEHDQVSKVIKSLPANVVQILGNSATVKWEHPIDVLFIDADHTYQGCRGDFLNFGPWVRAGGLICFDDYTQPNNPNNGVHAVVNEIIKGRSDTYTLIHEGYYCAILLKLKNDS